MHGITIPKLSTLSFPDLVSLKVRVETALHKNGHRPKVNPDIIAIQAELDRR